MSANRFFAGEETVQVELGDGFWVELKRELTYGEESELEAAGFRMAGLNPDRTPRFDIRWTEHRSLMLALYIVGWNLDGGNGQPVPLPDDLAKRRAVVTSLRSAWAKRLIARIEELRADEAKLDPNAGGTDENPTLPGGGSALETPSSSPNGLDAAIRTW